MKEEAMKKFFADYTHKGQRWSIDVIADDWQDAQERLGKAALAGISGESVLEIKVAPNWLVSVWNRLKPSG